MTRCDELCRLGGGGGGGRQWIKHSLLDLCKVISYVFEGLCIQRIQWNITVEMLLIKDLCCYQITRDPIYWRKLNRIPLKRSWAIRHISFHFVPFTSYWSDCQPHVNFEKKWFWIKNELLLLAEHWVTKYWKSWIFVLIVWKKKIS